MFNLSMLTSDMWAVVIRILFYRQQVFFSDSCPPIICYELLHEMKPRVWFHHIYMNKCEPISFLSDQILSSHCRLTGYTILLSQLWLSVLSSIQRRMLYTFCEILRVVDILLCFPSLFNLLEAIAYIAECNSEKNSIPIPSLENGNLDDDLQYQILDSENVASRNESSDSWRAKQLQYSQSPFTCISFCWVEVYSTCKQCKCEDFFFLFAPWQIGLNW